MLYAAPVVGLTDRFVFIPLSAVRPCVTVYQILHAHQFPLGAPGRRYSTQMPRQRRNKMPTPSRNTRIPSIDYHHVSSKPRPG